MKTILSITVVFVVGTLAWLMLHPVYQSPMYADAGEQGAPITAQQEDVRAAFERSYALWKEDCELVTASSLPEARLKSPHYQEIIDLGIPAVPLIVAKRREDPKFHWIGWAFQEITGVSGSPSHTPWAKELIVDWWEGGQKQADERVDTLIAQGKTEQVRYLGVAALPRLMERIESGEHELASVAEQITRGKAQFAGQTAEQKATSCLSWWQANKADWIVPFPDRQLSAP